MLQWFFQTDELERWLQSSWPIHVFQKTQIVSRKEYSFPKGVEVRTSDSPRNNFSATYHNSRYTSQESKEHRQKRLISASQYFGKVLDRITYSYRLAWAQLDALAALARWIAAWFHWSYGYWLDIMRRCIGIDGESSNICEGLKKAEWLVELFLRC